MDSGERFFSGLMTWVTIALATLAIVGAVWANDNGRDDHAHTIAVPEGVTKLTSSTYLVDPRVSVDHVCHGKSPSDDGPVKLTRSITHLHALYVVCSLRQRWEDHRPTLNWGKGITHTLTNIAWLIPIGLFLLVCLLPSATERMGEIASDRRRATEAAYLAAVKARKDASDAKATERARAALGAAWARDEIDQETFERKLAELVAQEDEA